MKTKFLGSDGLFSCRSICKFDSFKNPFATITSLYELYFRFRRFILLVQKKIKNFYELWQQHKLLKTMGMSEITWYLRWGIYTSIPTWTNSQNSLAAAEALSLKISSHGTEHLWNYHKDHPSQHKNSHKLCDETGHPILSLLESQWKLRQQHDQNFSMEGKPL